MPHPVRTVGAMSHASSLDEIWIEEEQLGDLLRILPHMKFTGSSPQWVGRVDADAPEVDTAPFLRALKRIEGAFLIDDGERLLGRPLAPIRSDAERLNDAFARLIDLMTHALRTRTSP